MKRLGARGILLIFGGILVVGFGLYMTWRLFQSALNPLPLASAPPPVTDKVLVTSRGIPLGSVLSTNDLILVEVPVGLVPLNRMNDLNQAIGRVTNISMVAGEMVLPHHLIDPSNVVDRSLAFSLADDQVMLAFPITDLMSGLNILKKGDVVDILVTIDEPVVPEGAFLVAEEAQTQLFTFDAMQRIAIAAVVLDIVQSQQPVPTPQVQLTPGAVLTPQPPPEPSRGQSKPVALMLALAPQDALVLKHLKDTGAIFDLVLRAPTSTELFDLTPVTSQYISERYQLLIR